jgi:aminopeptidase N
MKGDWQEACRRARAHAPFLDHALDKLPDLAELLEAGRGEDALAVFYARWREERLVEDEWFAVQATLPPPGRALAVVEGLTRHPDFDWRNPNRMRALIGAFASGNPAGFHRADGAGYRFLVDWLAKLDPVNPQTAARLTTAFGTWRTFDASRQALIRAELERLAGVEGLSRDTGEIVARLLGDGKG